MLHFYIIAEIIFYIYFSYLFVCKWFSKWIVLISYYLYMRSSDAKTELILLSELFLFFSKISNFYQTPVLCLVISLYCIERDLYIAIRVKWLNLVTYHYICSILLFIIIISSNFLAALIITFHVNDTWILGLHLSHCVQQNQ